MDNNPDELLNEDTLQEATQHTAGKQGLTELPETTDELSILPEATTSDTRDTRTVTASSEVPQNSSIHSIPVATGQPIQIDVTAEKVSIGTTVALQETSTNMVPITIDKPDKPVLPDATEQTVLTVADTTKSSSVNKY